jgi:NAD(P)-dependent dehydrogenase (short-subunit alcohol dehydrogenase family)
MTGLIEYVARPRLFYLTYGSFHRCLKPCARALSELIPRDGTTALPASVRADAITGAWSMDARDSLAGRIALVTGGSRGVGRAIARRLASRGATVAINYRRDETAAADAVAEIAEAGGIAHAYRAPMDDDAAVTAMVEAVRHELGAPSIIVSNAGSASRGCIVADTPMSEFESLLRVHALGPIRLLQAVMPDLRLAGRGDIVMISSATVASAPPGAAPYTMAKAAMETCVLSLAREERPHGIRANIVAPGLVMTDMGRRLVTALTDGGSIEDLNAKYPFGRVCRPDDIAGAVAFLVCNEASYITGQKIVVDGGGPEVSMV